MCPECRTAIVRHAINADFEEERNQVQESADLRQEVARLRQELEAVQRQIQDPLRLQGYDIQRGHRILRRLRNIPITIVANGLRIPLRPRYNRPYTFHHERKNYLAFELP